MARTDKLRRQHHRVTRLMTDIAGRIRAYDGSDDACPLTLGVAQLLGLLRVHLTQEDEHLYPELMNSRDRQTAAMARRFASEMGDIAERLEEFALRWSSSAVIAARFGQFRDETLDLFAALETRIRRENQQLYPLADRPAEPPIHSAAYRRVPMKSSSRLIQRSPSFWPET